MPKNRTGYRDNVLIPRKIVRYEFNGSVGATKAVIGASGGTGVTLAVPDLPLDAVPVAWGIQNLHASQTLNIRSGPDTATFVAAAGAVLGNYITLGVGQLGKFEDTLRHPYNLSNAVEQLPRMRVLVVIGSGPTTPFSGYCYAWIPE